MKKLLLACIACIIVLTSMIAEKANNSVQKVSNNTNNLLIETGSDYLPEVNYWIDSLYSVMNLAEKGLSRNIFFEAYKGYEFLLSQDEIHKQGILTICDYSQCSNKKRLYVLDLNDAKILFNTYVAHGRNSGNDFATSFSNTDESHKTCLGFMRTAETYNGEHGYSMKLDGLENGFNDNVRARTIVMHGSDYVNAERVGSGVLMGRSFGCPAVPSAEVSKIINSIKGGSCFFNYYPDQTYTQASKILNADFIWPVAQSVQLASINTPDSLYN